MHNDTRPIYSNRVPEHTLGVTWRPFVIVYETPGQKIDTWLNTGLDLLTGLWIGWASVLVNGLPGLCAARTILWWLHIALYGPHVVVYNAVLVCSLARYVSGWIGQCFTGGWVQHRVTQSLDREDDVLQMTRSGKEGAR
ncbi:hypothetical protein BD626DRAFT_475487 [Schizophyllum amplum]|uniref:Uncharacterized protein n=1 Tax=Schizophyllum amplum TaxID=97359 RepID=A0A550CYK6_9AGAR|nr:hypothetical protein BD626DRAFT_475487 [Auriculariopsis ampla]